MTELQKIDAETTAYMNQVARETILPIITWYSWETMSLEGLPLSGAEWLSAMTEITSNAIVAGSEAGLTGVYTLASVQKTSKYFMELETAGVTLSARLHDSAEYMEKVTTDTINAHIAHKTTWKRLADDLTRQRVSKSDFPKYMAELASAARDVGGDSAKLQKLIQQAEKNIALLKDSKSPTGDLKRAYSKVVQAVKKGDEAQLNRAVTEAIGKKATYNNQRISRTESARAYSQALTREAVDHPLYKKGRIAIQSLLSSGHAIVDNCDYHAQQNKWGLGEGVAPIEQAIAVPFHPNCLCSQQILVIPSEIDHTNLKESESANEKTMSSFTEKERKRVEYSLENARPEKMIPLPKDQVKKA